MLSYIREKLLGGSTGSRVGISGGGGTVNALSAEHAATLFRELASSELPVALDDDVRSLYRECVQAKLKLQTLFNPEASAAFKSPRLPLP